jgi:hypothetical protein
LHNYFSCRCSKEYVEVRDGGTEHSKVIGKYCDLPSSQFTTDNMMFVKFYTELNDPSNGFKARITLGKIQYKYCHKLYQLFQLIVVGLYGLEWVRSSHHFSTDPANIPSV